MRQFSSMDTISNHNFLVPLRFQDSLQIPNWNLPPIPTSHSNWKENLQVFKDKYDMSWKTGGVNPFTQTDGTNPSNKDNRPMVSYVKKPTSLQSTGKMFRKYILSKPQTTMGKTNEQEADGFKRSPRRRLFPPMSGSNLCPRPSSREQELLPGCSRSDLASPTSSNNKHSKGQHTIFYSGDINVHDNVPVDKFQCQPPKRVQILQENVFRKKRSFQKQASQNGWDKHRCYFEAMSAKEVAMKNVEEAQGKANESFASAVLKRKRAQTLMENADLATYLAAMALKIADRFQSADSSASLLPDW